MFLERGNAGSWASSTQPNPSALLFLRLDQLALFGTSCRKGCYIGMRGIARAVLNDYGCERLGKH